MVRKNKDEDAEVKKTQQTVEPVSHDSMEISDPAVMFNMIMPMIMIFLVNAALSYAYLKLERRQAIIFGVVIGFFTAPWLLPIVPYAFDWVV